MTDQDLGDERDPLLVRPFMLQDGETPDPDPSTQTWPSATTREVRSTHAAGGPERTPIRRRSTPARPRGERRYRRRLLVIGGVGTAVIIAATAAGFAALRPEVGSPVSAGPDGSPLPAVSGPAPSGAPGPSAARPEPKPAATHRTHRSGSPSAGASAAGPGVLRSAGGPSVSAATATPGASGLVQRNSRVAANARTGAIRGPNGLCLDLAADIPIDGNQVQVFTCNGSPAQTWTLATDGTLQVGGKCALVVGDSTVHIVACDDRTTARWRVDGSSLVNAADDECLADPSNGRQPGTAVQVGTCADAVGQHWTLP